MMMRKMMLALAFAPLMAFATSTPAGFTDNLDEALVKAKAENKLVYACFSGSDWCIWCKRLEGEVLSKPEFVSAVTNDYVLVYIDTPQNIYVLSDRAKIENPKLVAKYGIQGFPTALILTGDGEKVGRTGYRRGGPVAYAEHLAQLRKQISAPKEAAPQEPPKPAAGEK